MAQLCRLLLDAPAAGSWNMAVDEALLESTSDSAVPTLRMYRWAQPTLSLGYFQRIADRASHLESIACDIVRRATGGGAIVHDKELTYSLSIPSRNANRLHGELYSQVHASLINALKSLGAEASTVGTADRTQRDEQPFLCFERRSAQDVVVGDAKIAGSAQRRRAKAVLQHGSVLLCRTACAPQLAGIADLVGRPIAPSQLEEAWLARLSDDMNYEFQSSELTPKETSSARRIEQSRYLDPHWLERR